MPTYPPCWPVTDNELTYMLTCSRASHNAKNNYLLIIYGNKIFEFIEVRKQAHTSYQIYDIFDAINTKDENIVVFCIMCWLLLRQSQFISKIPFLKFCNAL